MRARAISIARAAALASASLAPVAATWSACSTSPGNRFDCDCTFLTDYDDGSSLRITVCAPAAREAPAQAEPAARGCAQTGAPAPVEKCACKAASDAAPCTPGECLTK